METWTDPETGETYSRPRNRRERGGAKTGAGELSGMPGVMVNMVQPNTPDDRWLESPANLTGRIGSTRDILHTEAFQRYLQAEEEARSRQASNQVSRTPFPGFAYRPPAPVMAGGGSQAVANRDPTYPPQDATAYDGGISPLLARLFANVSKKVPYEPSWVSV